MKTFIVKFHNKYGVLYCTTVDAMSAVEAVELLQNNGFFIESIEEI